MERKSENHLAQLITNHTKNLKALLKTNVFLKLKNANENETEILNSNKSCKTEQSTFQNDNAKAAFTLAEVLITLGIIGIVAAMTLPALIAKYQKRQTVEQFKKAYSAIAQALKLSELDNGSMESWEYRILPQEFYNRYLKNYLKSSQEIPHSEIKKRITYKYLNGRLAEGLVGNPATYTVKLSDGTFLMIDKFNYDENFAQHNIAVDLNGYSGPNQIGKDVFYLIINNKKGLIPYNNRSIESQACKAFSAGYNCSAKIIEDGWQIKDDYPW